MTLTREEVKDLLRILRLSVIEESYVDDNSSERICGDWYWNHLNRWYKKLSDYLKE